MTIHIVLTWWWLIWAGVAVWAFGVLVGWFLLSIADDWWLWQALAILIWPLWLAWVLVSGIAAMLWEHR